MKKSLLIFFNSRKAFQIDELYFKSGLKQQCCCGGFLMLEMQGILVSLPGKFIS